MLFAFYAQFISYNHFTGRNRQYMYIVSEYQINNLYFQTMYIYICVCVFICLYCKVMYDQNVKIRQKKMETIYEVNSQIAI